MGESIRFYDTIEKSFEELGVSYNKEIVEKCVDLCVNHGIDEAEELVDSWMAFSVSHLHGDDPTAQHLAKFERDVLAKKKRVDSNVCESTLNITDPNCSDLLSAYNATPQRKARTPDAGRPLKACFSPASFSPVAGTPSSRYEGRRNARSVMCERVATRSVEEDWFQSVTICDKTPGDLVNEKYMAFQLTDFTAATEKHMNKLIARLTEKFQLEEILPIRTKHPTPIITAGRVVCDADGKLNCESALLESSPESGGEIVKLDLSSVPSQAVFPGQVLAVCGLNVSGSKLVAQTVWSDAALPNPPAAVHLPGVLKIMVASGPYTTTDSLTYQPLIDFLSEVVKVEPHLLILTGPLIDSDHPMIRENSIAEAYSDMFERLISQIMQPLNGLKTEVIYVSSYRDTNGPCAFPTPPCRLKRSWPKLKFVSDPCIFDVQGISVAVTSTDVLMHLGKEEASPSHHSSDRLSRLAGHILQQQSMYPLRPPPPEVPLDPNLEASLILHVNPHLLILPSDLRCFIKDINNVTVLNPEHLAKGLVGGSYAKLNVATNGAIHGQVMKV